MPPLPDMTTDALFDYVVAVNISGSPPDSTVFVDLWDLNTQTSTFKGLSTMESGSGVLEVGTTGSNQWGMQVALNNLNTAGVVSCSLEDQLTDPCFIAEHPCLDNPNTGAELEQSWCDSIATVEALAATATTGFEIAVPLADLGINPCDGAATIHLWALITSASGFRTNQALPSVRPEEGNPESEGQVDWAQGDITDWFLTQLVNEDVFYRAVTVTHTTTPGLENDCNAEDGEDVCEILNGLADDVNENGVPDECENFCGDGIVDSPNDDGVFEDCDDGTTLSPESATCDSDCTPVLCGDGNMNQAAGETCDDGNTISLDGCDANCVDEFCGDGTINDVPVEQCDGGNTATGDGCDENCILEVCGNGIVQSATEGCDDANTANGDGCSSTCVVESGWICVDNVSICTEDCGDGQTVGSEKFEYKMDWRG